MNSRSGSNNIENIINVIIVGWHNYNSVLNAICCAFVRIQFAKSYTVLHSTQAEHCEHIQQWKII